MPRILTYCFLLFLFTSCSKDKVQLVPTEVEAYVDLFFLEGKTRGLQTSLEEEDLIIQFGQTIDGAIGQCQFNNSIITLDPDKWATMDEQEKTWIIFHELGHCILERRHRNEKAATGDCLSIMNGKEDFFNCSLNFYSERWWTYYLDELFDPTVQWSDWFSKYKDFNSVALGAQIIAIDTTTTYFEINNILFDSYDNFAIDFEFENWNTDEILAKFYLGNIGFSSCNICTGTNVRIATDMPNKLFYRNSEGEFQYAANARLTIRKIDNDFYFYLNETYVHSFECELWSGDNQISTINFEEALHMKLIISKIE